MRRLKAAKIRLDRLDYYPAPVNIDRVRVLHWPWLFRLPGLGKWAGFAGHRTILIRRLDEDLLVHELCHVWQSQHRWLAAWVALLSHSYLDNPFEAEARRAVEETR
jgi:hypothetical protein